ncbi:MAG: phosphatidate cytidylyltransferase [Bacteroidetes bacterium]|nr:phosphatidate cytidylyltransferase [Bacteroidota bacterium]MCL5026505.1 phosphatidate cytidylyltransferase [Chloroflexota bacterium]
MLRYRVVTALWLVPLFLIVLYLGSWVFGAFLGLLALLAAVEVARLLRAGGYQPSVAVIAGLPLLLLAGVYAGMDLASGAVALVLVASLVYYVFRYTPASTMLPSWGLSIAAAIYLAWPLQHFAMLRQAEALPIWAAWALVGTWVCDTGAYLVGRAIGRRPLYPRVSPGKTWEGTIGGVMLTAVVSAAAALLLSRLGVPAMPATNAAALGLVIGLAAIMGDLAESFLKRATGTKDSGALLPGHGGVLDRIDSLLFAVLAVYYFRALTLG